MAHGGMLPIQNNDEIPDVMADEELIGQVPGAIIEDSNKFNETALADISPSDIPALTAMAQTTDMGIPRVLPSMSEQQFSGNLSNVWDPGAGARFGLDIGGRGGSGGGGIGGRGSLRIPHKKNILEFGVTGEGHRSRGRGGDVNLTGADIAYHMPTARQSFLARYASQPESALELEYQRRFQKGGAVRMQEGRLTDVDLNEAFGVPIVAKPVAPPDIASPVAMNPMQGYQAANATRYQELQDRLKEMIASGHERAEKRAQSQAMIAFGAGIAGGSVAEGLGKAGMVMSDIRNKQADREQALQLELMKTATGIGFTDLPSSVQEYEYFTGLSSVEQQNFMDLKRQNYKVVEVNGVPTLVRQSGSYWHTPSGAIVEPDAPPIEEGQLVPGAARERVVSGEAEGPLMIPLTTPKAQIEAAKLKARSEYTEEQRQTLINDAPFAISTYSAATTKSNEIDRALDDAIDILESNPSAAGWGVYAGWVPTSDSRKLKKRISTIQARLAFGELQDMRTASKTGGALGQVSERELDLLRDASIAIDQAASAEDLTRQINLVRRRYKGFKSGALRRYAEMMLDPVYDNQAQIRRRFLGDLNQFKKDLMEGDAIERKAAQEFFEHYERAGGTAPTSESVPAVTPATTEVTEDEIAHRQQLQAEIEALKRD